MTTEETLDTLFQYRIGDRVYPAVHVPAIEAACEHALRLARAGAESVRVPEFVSGIVVERIAQQCHGGVQFFYLVAYPVGNGERHKAIAMELVPAATVEATVEACRAAVTDGAIERMESTFRIAEEARELRRAAAEALKDRKGGTR